MLNRAFFQPGDGLQTTFGGIVLELEAVVECETIEKVFDRLEEHQITVRLDPSIQPSMLKGATVSLGELEQLRRINRVVRLGHVTQIFTEDTIVLQPITRVSLSLSAGLIGVVEASGRPTAEKNRLCPPNMWFDTPFDWMRHLLTGMRSELEWRDAPDVQAWMESSRLNLMRGLDQSPDKAILADLQNRFLTALFPALEAFQALTANAAPAERARMFESV